MKLLYTIINFLILAGGLFLVGRKPVGRLFRRRQEKIAEDLAASEAGHRALEAAGEQIRKVEEAGAAELADVRVRMGEHTRLRCEESSARALAEIARREESLKDELERSRISMLLQVENEVLAAAAAAVREQITEVLPADFDLRCAQAIASLVEQRPGDRVAAARIGALQVTVTTAKPLPQRYLTMLENAVRAAFSGLLINVPLKMEALVEPAVIGGVCLRVCDTVYETGIRRTLEQLKRRVHLETPELTDGAEELDRALRCALEQLDTGVDIYQVGRVESISDGICQISGLSGAMYGELVEFACGAMGMVLDLEKERVGCVVFGAFEKLEEGQSVRRSGHVIEVPVGNSLLGRVVDVMGNPIDGLGDIHAEAYRPVEVAAPSITQRKSVSVPLHTGIKAIDALVPIGRGQRELIIGDRQTGKTAIAIDAILNQKGKDVICIYVAIGQKEISVANVREVLRKHGALSYTIIVCADAYHSAPRQYIAPYSGAAMGEYFMYQGKDVLIVYDDLSKHAVAYRELSLLLHRPSGREAFPGDVFYLHSRLLERSARLSDEMGGGSMTALPIIETQGGDISAYIPTNAISITDGQIFLESDLFHEGQRPAVNVGLSVSRVGGTAQTKAMRQVAGRLRMELAQYRELAAFSQFGSDLDETTRASLELGRRMSAALNQPQYAPMPMERQVLILYAVSEGFAADISVEEIPAFETGLYEYFESRLPEIMAKIRTGAKMPPELLDAISDGIRVYKEQRL